MFRPIVAGKTMKRQASTVATAKAMDTKIGRKTVTTDTDAPGEPKLETTWTMANPSTSSSIAALVRTTPRRVAVSLLERRTAKVVPRLVEQRAAPAAKHCRVEASVNDLRMKESAMGAEIPVSATPSERATLAFKELKEVRRPPVIGY